MLSGAGFGLQQLELERMGSQEARLKAQIQEVAPLLDQMHGAEADYQRLAPRLKTLEGAQNVTSRWSRILDHLSKNVPDGLWMTALRTNSADPEKPIEVSFVGVAKAQEPVGELIMRLQNSADLQTVGLRYTQEKMVQDTRATEYEVSGTITGSAPDKPKDATKEEK